jgi:hypothetical protein
MVMKGGGKIFGLPYIGYSSNRTSTPTWLASYYDAPRGRRTPLVLWGIFGSCISRNEGEVTSG